MNVFELFAKLSLDDSDFEKAVDKSAEKFDTLGDAAEGVSKGTKKAEKALGDMGSSADGAAAATGKVGDAGEEAALSATTLANKIKIVQARYDMAQKNVVELSKALNRSVDETGAASDETALLAVQLAKAEEEAKTYGDGLKKVNKNLNDTDDASDGAAGGIKGFAGQMQAAIVKGQLMATVIAAAVGVLKQVAEWVFHLDESTEEYREAQGKLNTAFEAAGFSAKDAKKAYGDFYKIIGDTDTATEAAQLLAKLTDNSEDLSKWTNIAAGVYGTFGDALPINGLIESANETAKVGQVTGVLADALNWAGISEEAFNASLSACSDESERNQMIMETLSGTYSAAADTFYANNEQLIQHRENQIAVQESTAKLGAAVGNFKDNILAKLAPTFEKAADKGVEFINKLDETFNKTGAAEAFGDILDAALGLLEPIGTLINVLLPPLITLLKPVASLLALIADTANVAIGLLTLNPTMVNTGLGLNVKYGMLSNKARIDYAEGLETSVYDPEAGGWVGNGSTTSETTNYNYYNMTVDASGVKEINDMARIAENQRVTRRMGVN